MTARCDWCGVFVRADTKPTRFLNVLGDPVVKLLCPDDAYSCCHLAARNVLRAPHLPFLQRLRDERGSG
jgi:hypothetical protein